MEKLVSELKIPSLTFEFSGLQNLLIRDCIVGGVLV